MKKNVCNEEKKIFSNKKHVPVNKTAVILIIEKNTIRFNTKNIQVLI